MVALATSFIANVPHRQCNGRYENCWTSQLAIVSQGKIRVAFNHGESVPLDWLIESEGEPTVGPAGLDENSAGRAVAARWNCWTA